MFGYYGLTVECSIVAGRNKSFGCSMRGTEGAGPPNGLVCLFNVVVLVSLGMHATWLRFLIAFPLKSSLALNLQKFKICNKG